MAAYYRIEGDYYITLDRWSWNIGKLINKKRGKEFSVLGYCSSLEDALSYYLELKRRETTGEAGESTIESLIDKLTADTKKFIETLLPVILRNPENLRP